MHASEQNFAVGMMRWISNNIPLFLVIHQGLLLRCVNNEMEESYQDYLYQATAGILLYYVYHSQHKIPTHSLLMQLREPLRIWLAEQIELIYEKLGDQAAAVSRHYLEFMLYNHFSEVVKFPRRENTLAPFLATMHQDTGWGRSQSKYTDVMTWKKIRDEKSLSMLKNRPFYHVEKSSFQDELVGTLNKYKVIRNIRQEALFSALNKVLSSLEIAPSDAEELQKLKLIMNRPIGAGSWLRISALMLLGLIYIVNPIKILQDLIHYVSLIIFASFALPIYANFYGKVHQLRILIAFMQAWKPESSAEGAYYFLQLLGDNVATSVRDLFEPQTRERPRQKSAPAMDLGTLSELIARGKQMARVPELDQSFSTRVLEYFNKAPKVKRTKKAEVEPSKNKYVAVNYQCEINGIVYSTDDTHALTGQQTAYEVLQTNLHKRPNTRFFAVVDQAVMTQSEKVSQLIKSGSCFVGAHGQQGITKVAGDFYKIKMKGESSNVRVFNDGLLHKMQLIETTDEQPKQALKEKAFLLFFNKYFDSHKEADRYHALILKGKVSV